MERRPVSASERERELKALHEAALSAQREGRAEETRAALARTTALAIEAYGAEVRGWLLRRLGDPVAVADLFQETCAALWRALPGFRWESSLKSWFYKIAFYTTCRLWESRRSARGRLVDAELSDLALDITSLDSRLDKRRALLEALEELPAPDREVLLLRQVAGEELGWRELALSLRGHVPLDGEALDREAARLRQRFHRAMAALQVIARRKGLPI
jgi:RNA polymerase sigma-70 factor, ECF subfamily